jgi:CheY-like chemotaxis protein
LADSGIAAIELFQTEVYDLILMDGSMPDIDGFEAARRIRAIEQAKQRKRVPIVALTAHVAGEAANAWRLARMDDVLYKPYTLANLAACIARQLRSGPLPNEECKASHESRPVAKRQLLDPSALNGLLEMSNGDTKIVERVTRLYCDHAPMRLAELRDALSREDFKRVASAAHALQSMSLNIGACAVAETAANLEKLAHNETPNLTASMIEEFATLATNTRALLAQKAAQ